MTERLTRLDLPAKCYKTFNIGNLGGVMHRESSTGNLIPSDIDVGVAGVLSSLVNRYGLQNVQCLDLGGALGVGFDVVRSILTKAENYHVTCTVTNKELYNPQDSIKALEMLRKYRRSNPKEIKELLGHWFCFPTASELEIARRRSPEDIRYISQVDTINLVELKQQIAPNGFHLIHEYFGGLEHNHYQRDAMKAVMNSLDPNVGMLITGFNSLLYWESLPEWEKRGVTVYGAYPDHQFMTTKILILAFPEAPIATLEKHLNYFHRVNTQSYQLPTVDNQELG